MPEKDTTPAQSPERERNSRDMGRQFVGAAVGAFIALAVVRVGDSLGWQPANANSIILLGGAVGAILNDLERFDRAGSRLTRRPSRGNRAIAALNIGIALMGLLLIMGLVLGLSALIGLIL